MATNIHRIKKRIGIGRGKNWWMKNELNNWRLQSFPFFASSAGRELHPYSYFLFILFSDYVVKVNQSTRKRSMWNWSWNVYYYVFFSFFTSHEWKNLFLPFRINLSQQQQPLPYVYQLIELQQSVVVSHKRVVMNDRDTAQISARARDAPGGQDNTRIDWLCA